MITIRPYQTTDDAALIKLCNIPVSGDLVLALERSPSYIAGSKIQTRKPQVYVCEDEKIGAVGVFNIGTRPAFVNEKMADVHYLCDLRIHPDFQNGSLFLRILRFVASLNLNWNVLAAMTVVFADNQLMVEMIQKQAKKNITGLPLYHQVATITSFLFSSKNTFKSPPDYLIRRAESSDLEAMDHLREQEQKHLAYAPFESMSSNDQSYNQGLSVQNYLIISEKSDPSTILGFMALWDTSAIKTTRIIRYPFYLKALKAILPLLSFLPLPILPKGGGLLKTLYLHDIVIKDRSEPLFSALLSHICKTQNYPANLLCTLDERDPLHSILKAKPWAIQKKGFVYLVNFSPELPQDFRGPYVVVDAARI